MLVLCISSLKGGVGKTTVALGLASSAFARGLRTLVVDLDPQCDATNALGAIGEYRETIADVLANPSHHNVHKAIVPSTWGKVRSGHTDVMIGSAKALSFDDPNLTLRDVWKLEEALSKVEKDYDIAIIDTPPSMNGLTRTAWAASDLVLVVSEPSFFSVVAADRALKAVTEMSQGLTSRLRPLGILVNRYQPMSKEHEFRVSELTEMMGDMLLDKVIEERAAIQQAQGAGRAIHTWPGKGAQETAEILDEVLDMAFDAIEVA